MKEILQGHILSLIYSSNKKDEKIEEHRESLIAKGLKLVESEAKVVVGDNQLS